MGGASANSGGNTPCQSNDACLSWQELHSGLVQGDGEAIRCRGQSEVVLPMLSLLFSSNPMLNVERYCMVSVLASVGRRE